MAISILWYLILGLNINSLILLEQIGWKKHLVQWGLPCCSGEKTGCYLATHLGSTAVLWALLSPDWVRQGGLEVDEGKRMWAYLLTEPSKEKLSSLWMNKLQTLQITVLLWCGGLSNDNIWWIQGTAAMIARSCHLSQWQYLHVEVGERELLHSVENISWSRT